MGPWLTGTLVRGRHTRVIGGRQGGVGESALRRERPAAARGQAEPEPDQLMNPASIADTYWGLYTQPRDAWTHELDIRPYRESF